MYEKHPSSLPGSVPIIAQQQQVEALNTEAGMNASVNIPLYNTHLQRDIPLSDGNEMKMRLVKFTCKFLMPSNVYDFFRNWQITTKHHNWCQSMTYAASTKFPSPIFRAYAF